MPDPDVERWNVRYLNDERFSTFLQPRPFLVQNAYLLSSQGLALDAAMGLGGNAGFLLERGWRVVGVDISEVAVRRAKIRLPDLYAVIADMKSFWLPTLSFDAILNFYYLQRDLWPRYSDALRPGGLLFIQSLTLETLRVQPEIDPVFLLAPGELLETFAGWEILSYRESWEASRRGRPQALASLVACKPGGYSQMTKRSSTQVGTPAW